MLTGRSCWSDLAPTWSATVTSAPWPHEGLSDPPTIVQEAIIRAGWSPLWEKYGKVPFAWRPRLVKAEQEAREAQAGAWATDPTYMTNKANETTAPKGTK